MPGCPSGESAYRSPSCHWPVSASPDLHFSSRSAPLTTVSLFTPPTPPSPGQRRGVREQSCRTPKRRLAHERFSEAAREPLGTQRDVGDSGPRHSLGARPLPSSPQPLPPGAASSLRRRLREQGPSRREHGPVVCRRQMCGLGSLPRRQSAHTEGVCGCSQARCSSRRSSQALSQDGTAGPGVPVASLDCPARAAESGVGNAGVPLLSSGTCACRLRHGSAPGLPVHGGSDHDTRFCPHAWRPPPAPRCLWRD